MFTMDSNLKIWADKYETAEFIEKDPIQIPHRYKYSSNTEFVALLRTSMAEKANIEIVAFVTSWIAFGNRNTIISKADFIDREIFKGKPFGYIINKTWMEYKDSNEIFYRFFKYSDFHNLCERLFDIYQDNFSMEDALLKVENKNPVEALQLLFGNVEGIPEETSESACKRLCLFLRWMCRPNSPVDFGIWTICKPENLIIPLDTHVHSLALNLGLTNRKVPDIIAAIEITDRFDKVFPNDPSRGSFSLYGYEIDPDAPKLQYSNVNEMSIEDVLKLPLFYEVVSAEITDICDKRNAARKKANSEGMRLKAHPIEQLEKEGYLEPGKFIVAYAQLIDKVSIGFSFAQREFLNTLGNTAFHKTVKILIKNEAKDEKERDKRNRESNK